MKNIKYLFISLLAVFFIACEDDFETPNVTVPVQGTAPVLEEVTEAIDLILEKKNEKDTVVNLSWSAATYADPIGVRYYIQVDTVGNEFKNALEFERVSTTTTSITVGALNTLISTKYAPAKLVELEVRIRAFANEDLDNLYTASFTMKVTPYLDVAIPSELYIFGNATSATEISAALKAFGSDDIFTKYLKLTKDSLFKFSDKQASDGFDYNFGKFATVSENIEAAGDDAGNFKFTGETGWYAVTADFMSSSLTITPYMVESTTYGYDYDNLYIVGGYNSTDPFWDAANAVAMTKKSEGVFTIEKELQDGAEFKFIGQQSWGDLDWGNIAEKGQSGILAPKGKNDNITFDGADAVYNITVNLNAGTYTIEAKPVYPTELYMTGNGVGPDDENWDWKNKLQFVPVHSHPELFWKIVWMKGSGNFKCAPQPAWSNDFGREGDAVNGVYTKGGTDIPVPSTEGYYMVVVDLENNTIEIAEPKVYGMGNVFGGWDGGDPADLFTVDNANKVIKFDGVPNDGELRMYVDAPTLNCDWWQAEFIVLDGMIEFRGTGGDQTRVNVTAGDNISLNFLTGAGSITTP
ncbi:SusF/SusE family outer membrane protein [Ancylomarina salipaludis]|uniref:SusF/SusE family outer membrane protein n=1 Tax=Ancylomarina salipaludis TaxID=2501299 RepID=A0A4Q1JNJ0_9BACT|nr:SusF/SusE family outer membrane protein [Ancylomarina salipaludis]RXQ96274.1 SusF/SusE family outer membrane protein [Ancylomarina salipaludis]